MASSPVVRMPVEPPLVGRDAAVAALAELAGAGEAVLVVAGPPGAGTTRVARAAGEAAAGERGLVLDVSREPGDAAARMEAAAVEAGSASRRDGPLVVLVGDVLPGEPVPTPPAALRRAVRVVVVATSREPRGEHPTAVLEPLPAHDARALAVAAAPGLDASTADEVARLADGLPGCIVALARAARDRPGPDAPLPVPPSLAGPVAEGLAGVSPPAADVALWAAVLAGDGGRFDLAAVRRVIGYAPQWTDRALDELAGAGVLRTVEGAGPPAWAFAAGVAPAVVESLAAPGERRRRHAAALADGRRHGLPVAALAHHATAAGLTHEVIDLSIAASQEARAAGAAGEALRHAARAVRWARALDDPRRALDAAVEHGVVLSDLGHWAEAAEVLEAAAEGLRDLGEPEPAIGAWCEASNARWHVGDHSRALGLILDRALAEPDVGAASPARAHALLQAAGFGNMMGRFLQGVALGREARAALVAAGDTVEATRALVFVGAGRVQAGDAAGLHDLDDAAEEARAGSGSRNETLAAIQKSHVLVPYGRPGEAVRVARAGIARAEELAIRDHEAVLRLNLADALLALGHLQEGAEELRRSTALLTELGLDDVAITAPTRAWLALQGGDVEAALSQFHSMTRQARADGTHFEHLASAATGHALAAAVNGFADEARRIVAVGLGMWRLTDDRLLGAPLLAVGAETGDDAVASACADALEGCARRSDAGRAFAEVAAGMLAERGEHGAGSDRLAAGAGMLEDLGLRWWAARTLMAAGGGHPDAAAGAELLQRARRGFEMMGAAGWRARCEAQLRGMGHRVSHREAGEGQSGLTPRESEVLAHLTEGLTNKQIGERLYISERTVARHLIQVFAKLGVTTRLAAVAAARDLGLLDAPAEPADTPGTHDSGVVILSPAG